MVDSDHRAVACTRCGRDGGTRNTAPELDEFGEPVYPEETECYRCEVEQEVEIQGFGLVQVLAYEPSTKIEIKCQRCGAVFSVGYDEELWFCCPDCGL